MSVSSASVLVRLSTEYVVWVQKYALLPVALTLINDLAARANGWSNGRDKTCIASTYEGPGAGSRRKTRKLMQSFLNKKAQARASIMPGAVEYLSQAFKAHEERPY